MRHSAQPLYSPEPDCVHELLGHMPLLADADFAQFSQEIGLASLGASDEQVQNLCKLYFFTIEFGLCRAPGTAEFKVYGAGLLSSIGELRHALDDAPLVRPFDPVLVVQQTCLITTYQASYFYTESFDEAQTKLRTYVATQMRRPFHLRYNAHTESVEVLNNKRTLTLAVNALRSDINVLAAALHQIL